MNLYFWTSLDAPSDRDYYSQMDPREAPGEDPDNEPDEQDDVQPGDEATECPF